MLKKALAHFTGGLVIGVIILSLLWVFLRLLFAVAGMLR